MNTRKHILFGVTGAWLAMGAAALVAGEAAVAELVGGLKSPDDSARLKAIDELGSRGARAADAVTPLAELLKDGSAKVRAHAAHSLGQIGAPAKSAASALVAAMGDLDETVRRQALGALGAIRPGPQVTVPLFAKLMEDADPGVRLRVMHVIAEAGAPAVPALSEALKNDKAAYWACLVLRDIGPAAKDAVPALADKLKDPRPEVRREVILTLAAMDDAAMAAQEPITGALGDEHTRTAATYALGRIGRIPAEAEAKIRGNIASDDKMLSTTSLWALARVHPEDRDLRRQAGEQLIERLKDQNPFVRVAAARGLAALPPAPEIMAPIWEKALQNADETTVRHAMDALAALGAPAVPRLTDALKHEKNRAEVAFVLGQIGPPAAPATEALARLTEDKNPRVVEETVLALAKIGPGAKAAVPALVKLLGKTDEAEAHAAAYALGKIGPDAAAAAQAMRGLLKSPDASLALASAWALVQIQPASAEIAAETVPVLIKGLTATDPIARCGAAESLRTLGPAAKDAIPALQKAVTDPDESVRAAAAEAIKAIPVASSEARVEAGATATFVVTLQDGVELKLGKTAIANLPKGTRLKVIQTQDPWLGVTVEIDGQKKKGWVLQSQVGKP